MMQSSLENGDAYDDNASWIDPWAAYLGTQNLTFIPSESLEGQHTPPPAVSPLKPERPKKQRPPPPLPLIPDPDNDSEDQIGCLIPPAYCMVKTAVLLFVKEIVYDKIHKDCYGCEIEHPSQKQHSCLTAQPEYYIQGRMSEIKEALFTPGLFPALQTLLKDEYQKD